MFVDVKISFQYQKSIYRFSCLSLSLRVTVSTLLVVSLPLFFSPCLSSVVTWRFLSVNVIFSTLSCNEFALKQLITSDKLSFGFRAFAPSPGGGYLSLWGSLQTTATYQISNQPTNRQTQQCIQTIRVMWCNCRWWYASASSSRRLWVNLSLYNPPEHTTKQIPDDASELSMLLIDDDSPLSSSHHDLDLAQ